MLKSLIVVSALCGILASSGCDACGNDIRSEIDSPDGLLRIVTYRRACGATTGFSTHLSILERGHQPDDGGNALVIDDDHGKIAVDEHQMIRVHASWVGRDEVRVAYPSGARVFKKETNVGSVRITYVEGK